MNYDKLDNDELLRLSLDAINNGRDADAVVMLKTLLEREPEHVYAQYLLAAQHAQLGMLERAEAGFRRVVEQAPDLAPARFQLGQLLVTTGQGAEAKAVLAPLASNRDSLAAYARAMVAAADEDAASAIRELEAGLALPQEIPALAADMQRFRGQLSGLSEQAPVLPAGASGAVQAAPMFLTGYGREV